VPFEVTSAEALPALTGHFRRTQGWTGGDGAYSFPLAKGRTLWLFADTWIGRVEAGRRVDARMVSNSAAWQTTDAKGATFRFFWGTGGQGPTALLRPSQADCWYWPADGALVDGRLYLFCKLVRRKADGEPGLQFDWFDNELLQIGHPQDEPTAWKIKRCPLPRGAGTLRLGVACLVDGEYLYVYGLFPAAACKPLDTPLALARVRREQLAALRVKDWQYWCRGPKHDKWADEPADPVPLFRDAAPEMTVSRVRGIDGWVATYTPLGLGADIVVRHARRPEGPWSRPLRVYRCPEADGKLLLYGAKAHPELTDRDGQLILTYCRNVGALTEHVRQPDLYRPVAVNVQLRPRQQSRP
jgi:hypothetical protein